MLACQEAVLMFFFRSLSFTPVILESLVFDLLNDDFQGEEAPVLRKCFAGVQRNDEVIRVRDTVLLRSGPRNKSLPYVAKISALWEEPESGKLLLFLSYTAALRP